MSSEEYIKERVEEQIKWYEKKSRINKNYFNRLKLLEIILALFIPFFTNYITENNIEMKQLIGIFGIMVAAVAGILSLFKFQENWVEYRPTAESFKHEKYLFITNTGVYGEEEGFEKFVERIESIISKQNSNWTHYIKEKKKEKI